MSSNVISLSRHQATKNKGFPALLQSFAHGRRDPNEVFWLKENAEILNILECTGSSAPQDGIDVYNDFYRELPKRLAFFPQYYRFYVSIACDLEALGIEGDFAQQFCEFVQYNKSYAAELSDLQRAEAMRLLARREIKLVDEAALTQRLHRFINHSASFALPNRKAAYELTHIVFYLSEYGRRDPEISTDAIQSLMFTGILAHLEQNADLLAEVCIALRYAGKTPPSSWEYWINSVNNAFVLQDNDNGYTDNYHEFLVCNWACAQMQREPFRQAFSSSGTGFYSPVSPLGAIGQISEILLTMEGARSASWGVMEPKLRAALPDQIVQHLSEVVAATSDFDAFWEYFARVSKNHSERNSMLTKSVLEVAR